MWYILTNIYMHKQGATKNTHVFNIFQLDSSGSSYNFMSNSSWLWQIALAGCSMPMSSLSFLGSSGPLSCSVCRTHGTLRSVRVQTSVRMAEIRPAWRWMDFFLNSHQKAFPAMAKKRLLLRFFFGYFFDLFCGGKVDILFGLGTKSAWGGDKPSCVSEILSLSFQVSNDRKYRGWHPAQLYGDYFINDSWVVVSNIFYFHPYLGKWSNLTNIFQMGWNHQLDYKDPY